MKRKVINILWIVSMLTWALPLNIINTFILIGYLIGWRKKIKSFKYIENRLVVVTERDEYFGGLELGYAVLVAEKSSALLHELGHTLQCSIWGILYWFVIGIPSSIRYHYRNHLRIHNPNKYIRLKPYSSVWFEKQATNWGNKLYEKVEKSI